MVKIQTERFGEVDVPEEKLFHFQRGLLGFPGLSRYVLLDTNAQSPFKWLQSVDRPDLTFVVMDPHVARPDYRVEVSPHDVADLGVEDAQKVLLLAVVTVSSPEPLEMTVNLKGPLLINLVNGLAKQMVLLDEAYPVRWRLVPESAATRSPA